MTELKKSFKIKKEMCNYTKFVLLYQKHSLLLISINRKNYRASQGRSWCLGANRFSWMELACFHIHVWVLLGNFFSKWSKGSLAWLISSQPNVLFAIAFNTMCAWELGWGERGYACNHAFKSMREGWKCGSCGDILNCKVL